MQNDSILRSLSQSVHNCQIIHCLIQEKAEMSFKVLSDHKGIVAAKYDLLYEVPDYLRGFVHAIWFSHQKSFAQQSAHSVSGGNREV